MSVKTDPELMNALMGGEGIEKANRARDFFLALATCNTIVPILVDTPEPSLKLIDYQGESPDEQALVYAAAAYGFVLMQRTSGHILIDVLGERQRYCYSSCSFQLFASFFYHLFYHCAVIPESKLGLFRCLVVNKL